MGSKRIWIMMATAILAFSQGSSNGVVSDSLLSPEDILLEESQDRPALSATLNDPEYWESYNEWLCFDATEVELIRAQANDGRRDFMLPIVSVLTSTEYFEFSIHGEDDDTNERIYGQWNALLDGSTRVCVFAAYLNDLQDVASKPASTWIIRRLKTDRGEWDSWDRQKNDAFDSTPDQVESESL